MGTFVLIIIEVTALGSESILAEALLIATQSPWTTAKRRQSRNEGVMTNIDQA